MWPRTGWIWPSGHAQDRGLRYGWHKQPGFGVAIPWTVGSVLESTGGLELPLAGALAAASLPVAVVNPRQVDFAKATGRLTDALDAQVIAHFAEAVRPAMRPLPDSETRELHSLNARRTQVVEMLVAEKNRLGRAGQAVRPRIRAHIEWLEQELKDLDRGLRDMLRRSPVWRRPAALRPRSGAATLGSAAGRSWARWGEADSGPGGSGPHEPGQREHAGQEERLCMGALVASQHNPVSAASTNGSPAYAQAADHPQQHVERWDPHAALDIRDMLCNRPVSCYRLLTSRLSHCRIPGTDTLSHLMDLAGS